MRFPQLKISTAMMIILLLSLIIFLLMRPSRLGASILFSFTIIMLLGATIIAVQKQKIDMFAYVLFSSVYILTICQFIQLPEPLWLIVVEEIHIVAKNSQPTDADPEFSLIGSGDYIYSYINKKYYMWYAKDRNFDQVCHLLICQLFGIVGFGFSRVTKYYIEKDNTKS